MVPTKKIPAFTVWPVISYIWLVPQGMCTWRPWSRFNLMIQLSIGPLFPILFLYFSFASFPRQSFNILHMMVWHHRGIDGPQSQKPSFDNSRLHLIEQSGLLKWRWKSWFTFCHQGTWLRIVESVIVDCHLVFQLDVLQHPRPFVWHAQGVNILHLHVAIQVTYLSMGPGFRLRHIGSFPLSCCGVEYYHCQRLDWVLVWSLDPTHPSLGAGLVKCLRWSWTYQKMNLGI